MSTFADQARNSALYILENLAKIQELVVETRQHCRDSEVLKKLTCLQADLMPIKQECHALKVALSTARTCGEFRHSHGSDYESARMAAANDKKIEETDPQGGEMKTLSPEELKLLNL